MIRFAVMCMAGMLAAGTATAAPESETPVVPARAEVTAPSKADAQDEVEVAPEQVPSVPAPGAQAPAPQAPASQVQPRETRGERMEAGELIREVGSHIIRDDWTLTRGFGLNPIAAAWAGGSVSLLWSALSLGAFAINPWAPVIMMAVPLDSFAMMATNGGAGTAGMALGSVAGTVVGGFAGAMLFTSMVMLRGGDSSGIAALGGFIGGAVIGVAGGRSIGAFIGAGLGAQMGNALDASE